MNWTAVRKRLQRQSFDLLSQRHGALTVLVAALILVVTIVHFSESLVAWSTEKYAAVVNSFSDNLVGRSYRHRLCLPVPIDIVYTWVNGSDPRLIEELRSYKRSMLKEISAVDNESITKCEFESCVFANGVILEPPVPAEIELKRFALLYPFFKDATTLSALVDPITGHNVTTILFDNKNTAEEALTAKVIINDQETSIRRLFYTTDQSLRNIVPSTSVLMMTGFPADLDETRLLAALPIEYQTKVTKLVLHRDRGIAVLSGLNRATFDALLTAKNITIGGKSPTINVASLVWDLTDYSHDEDISASRFADNDELRYSLRSVERHAPWVRRIFIVTNGQIPSWLNLDDDRVTVISHADIFQNTSHLPTFSSPAIESHLHRIPGLSDRFIYMNDDVFFGRDVWPDDFLTASGAQKVYLTWPVPNCREGCPASWISDGYCDRACNNSQCEWDGGDCANGAGRVGYPLYGGSGGLAGSDSGYHHYRASGDLYCHQGCANNWIADRYCDQACNVAACGFDAADCGVADFNELFGIKVQIDVNYYDARGHNVFYFNVTTLVGSDAGYVRSGSYGEDSIIRSVSIARKFKVVTVVLYKNYTERVLNFTLAGLDKSHRNFSFNFTVLVNTLYQAEIIIDKTESDGDEDIIVATLVPTSETDSFVFIPQSDRFPNPKFALPKLSVSHSSDSTYPLDMPRYNLSTEIREELNKYYTELKTGELTVGGFNRLASSLWAKFLEQFEAEGRQPVLLLNTSFSDIVLPEEPAAMENEDSQTKNASSSEDANGTEITTNSVSNQFKSYLGNAKNRTSNPETSHYGRQKSNEMFRRQRQLNFFNEEENEIVDRHIEPLMTVLPEQKSLDPAAGFLPWEKLQIFDELLRIKKSKISYQNANDKNGNLPGRRRLLDTFADSLRHVSRIYNRAYGYTARRVPAHMPHMIDRRIMSAMQMRFPDEWDTTSSHRIRHPEDMQFAFSYFYFLISEPANSTMEEVFSEIDVDKTGALSDREIRILATRIYELPLDLKTLEGLEGILVNCSEHFAVPQDSQNAVTFRHEVYYQKRLPQVTLELIKQCEPIEALLQKHVKTRTKYIHEVVGEDDVTFKMLIANVSRVVAILDEIRRQPRKFVCLNDNIDYERETARTVKIVLRDFYESFFPKPSRFELPPEYRNRFLHVDELRTWWGYRTWLRWGAQGVFLAAVAFALISFFYDRIRTLKRRWTRR